MNTPYLLFKSVIPVSSPGPNLGNEEAHFIFSLSFIAQCLMSSQPLFCIFCPSFWLEVKDPLFLKSLKNKNEMCFYIYHIFTIDHPSVVFCSWYVAAHETQLLHIHKFHKLVIILLVT